jgi:hypothetical protein
VGRFRVPGPPTIIASLWGDAGESTTVFQGATVTESAARRMPNPGDLLNGLFPVSPAGAFRGRSALIATAAVLIGTFAQVIRLPGNTAYSTIWAEDASIFLNQALNKGILRSFTIPYAGYLHTVPRVIAAVAAVFPLQWAAAIFGIGSALVVSLLGVFLYRATEGLIHSVPMRLALSAMFVAIPVVGFETEANAANLHFYFDFVAIWALLWRPQSRIGTAASAAVCFLAAASDAITLFLLPIAIARLLVTRFGRGSAPAFALIAGLLIQLPVIVTSHDTHWAPNIPLDFAAVFSTRVALPFLVGGLLSNRLWADISWIAPAVHAADRPGCLGGVDLHRRGNRVRRPAHHRPLGDGHVSQGRRIARDSSSILGCPAAHALVERRDRGDVRHRAHVARHAAPSHPRPRDGGVADVHPRG